MRNGSILATVLKISYAIFWFLLFFNFFIFSYLKVRNVRQRYTADEVLTHPWVTRGAPKTPLQTATNLSRNDSARDVHQMNEHFLMMNRISPMIARLSSRLNAAAVEAAAVVVAGGGFFFFYLEFFK